MELLFCNLSGEPLPIPPGFDEALVLADDTNSDDIGGAYQVLMHPKVQRERKEKIPDDVLEAVARQKLTKTETILEPFGHRQFASFADCTAAMDAYVRENYLSYRIRNAASVTAHNKALAKLVTKKCEPVPDHMLFGARTYRCIHGLYQKSRSKGERKARITKYTACDARIVVEARKTDTDEWVAEVASEVIRHNHKCSAMLYKSYTTAGDEIDDKELFNDLHLMIQANATTARIRDVIAMRSGVRLTAQQLANFKRDRLGGRSALANLRLLLQRFSANDGSRCLIIEDEAALVCGIVLQSKAQRMLFDKFGDNLLLDWTHNTNNAGYYLGSLMATGVSGSGVSVLDFLCLTQTKDMMRTVFKQFIAWNPSAVTKVRSFVIDKDYSEWAVLKEMFPRSRVLLCQFHVMKWLVHVVQDPKFGLAVSLQESVVTVLASMVYSPTLEAYSAQQWLLEHMLEGEDPAFLAYMQERWYSCSDMWSDFERGTVFTATNTTTNRLESSWGHVKAILGLKLRLDMCLEAVFTYGTAVLDREIACIKTMAGPTLLLRSASDRFMRPVLAQVSDYCADIIEAQYAAHSRMLDSHFVVPDDDSPSRFVVEKYSGDGCHRTVDRSDWSCSCLQFVTTELPCRHLIFYSRVYAQDDFLPLDVVRKRWLVKAAVPMLPALIECRDQMQSLRTGLLLVDPSSTSGDAACEEDEEADTNNDLAFMSIQSKGHHPSVAHVRLARGEVAANVVLDNLEKRNVVVAEFQPLMEYMMSQSSPRFKSMATYLREMLDGLLDAFKTIPLTAEDEIEASISAAMRRCEITPQDQIRASVEDTLERQTPKTCRPAQVDSRAAAKAQAVLHPVLKRGGTGEPAEFCLPDEELRTSREAEQVVFGDDGAGEDFDDVSSLSMSCASAILQDAAVMHAQALSSDPATPAPALSIVAPIPFERAANNPTSSVAVASLAVTSTKRSADVAHLDGSILERIVIRVRESPAPGKQQKMRGRWKAVKRLAHVQQTSECQVDLHDFVQAARLTPGITRVTSALKAYPVLFNEEWLQKRPVTVDTEYVTRASFAMNFTVSQGLLRRFESALNAEKVAHPPQTYFDMNAPPLSDELVARIQSASAVRGFSDTNVATVRSFYDTMKSCETYAIDLAWLSRDDAEMPSEVRDAVINAIKNCALDTRYGLNVANENPPTSIALHNVLGHLAGKSWLNDAVLVFLLRQIADEVEGLLVVDCIRAVVGAPRPLFPIPSQQLAKHQVVIFPINLSQSHWCLICVVIDAEDGVRVTFYDSLAKRSNAEALRSEWISTCEPVVRGWCLRDFGKYQVDSLEVLSTPRQDPKDNNSCGIYCVATAYDFATGSHSFRSMPTFTPSFIRYLRLNFMRSILCSAERLPTPQGDWAAGVMATFDPEMKTA